jgi:hypothetical protein
MITDEEKGWLAGIIDGEGSVENRSRYGRSVRISNTDPLIIKKLISILEKWDIKYTITKRTFSDTWSDIENIAIYGRRNLEKLNTLAIYGSKKQKLQIAVESYVKDWEKHEIPTKEQLEQLIGEGLTQRQIADRLGFKSHGNAQYYLDKYGLKTRKRRYSENEFHQFVA